MSRIAQEFASSNAAASALSTLLEICREEFDFLRSFIVLYDAATEKSRPYATDGISAAEFRRLENYIEKSFIWQVLRDNKSVILPKTHSESTFSTIFENKFGASAETSCVCVPIVLGERVVGAFGVEFAYENDFDYENLSEFLAAAAAMISQALKVQRVIHREKEKLLAENTNLRRELREKYDFSHIIGNSSAMRRVYDRVTQVARSNATVLLRGESGTGKELIANAIHYNSLRTKKALIKINCAVLPETLIEAELFGYEKGAFTGARQRKKGRFEQAEGGTLFLDEIADLPPQAQEKLLRVIEERKFERLGGSETIRANVRLITATDKNLEEAVSAGDFREDLFYRLSAFTIFLPPLRERKADILLLADSFVEKYEREYDKKIKRISTLAIDMLSSYHFPGNVRELENTIERAVAACDGNVIHGHHLPPTLQTAEVTGTVTETSLVRTVEAFEKDLITDALKTTRGNCAKAARLLDTTERIIVYKINKYNIEPRRFKN